MNDMTTLPTVEQINLEHRLANSKASEAVQHATNCGLMLLQVKASKQHGEWLPWLNGEIESGRLAVKARQAQKYMQLASNTHRGAYLENSTSIRAALELLSDKDPEEQQQGSLIDVEVERKGREAAEAKAEAERQSRERFEQEAQDSKQRAEEFRQESNERRRKIRDLEGQIDLLKANPPEVRERIVAPADYETAKQETGALKAELHKIKQQQGELVRQQVASKLAERNSELRDLEAREREAQARLAHLQRQIDSYHNKERELAVHLSENEAARVALAKLAANMAGWVEMVNPDAERAKWLALADMMDQAAAAIRCFVGVSKPTLTVIRGGE